MTGDRERYIEAGMDNYIPKPINLAELKSIIELYHPHKVPVPVEETKPKPVKDRRSKPSKVRLNREKEVKLKKLKETGNKIISQSSSRKQKQINRGGDIKNKDLSLRKDITQESRVKEAISDIKPKVCENRKDKTFLSDDTLSNTKESVITKQTDSTTTATVQNCSLQLKKKREFYYIYLHLFFSIYIRKFLKIWAIS